MQSTPDFIPFTRPSLDEETVEAVTKVLRSGWLTGGVEVQAFENALSLYCRGRTVRTMASGTAALEIALRLAGIGPGDAVLTSPLTWLATANVILAVGARPVFVDVCHRTRLIDISKAALCEDTAVRAIIPVDLAGLPVNRVALYQLAAARGWRVIEDAAQSLGASWDSVPVGSVSDFAAFSFHATKNVTAGEGGALVLPADVDPGLCERWRLQGVTRDGDGGYDADVPGLKANLGEIAAAIGRVQLSRLEYITRHRRALARIYFENLPSAFGLELPVMDFENSNWHLFQVLLPPEIDRAWFIRVMRNMGVGVGVHYPAVHLMTLYRRLGYAPGDFPIAEMIGRRTVSLPMSNEMTENDVLCVCDTLSKALSRKYI